MTHRGRAATRDETAGDDIVIVLSDPDLNPAPRKTLTGIRNRIPHPRIGRPDLA